MVELSVTWDALITFNSEIYVLLLSVVGISV